MLALKNRTNTIRRELAARILELFYEGRLEQEIDRIPIDLYPRSAAPVRHSIYADRAVTRYRLMALLGISLETEDDELLPLSEYARRALSRDRITAPVLTVAEPACDACQKASHHVTELCRGCVARPCVENCPKGAIQVCGSRACIDAERCVNCGKCVSECPFHAIVHRPVPCESACPVDAIKRDEAGRTRIDFDRCISCGRCSRSCPFGAVLERSQIIDAARALTGPRPVVALLAPSVAGQYPGTVAQLVSAMRELGFDGVWEVARGAEATVEHEAREIARRAAEGVHLTATSCCPAQARAIRTHLPERADILSTTRSPMSYVAEEVRTAMPEAVVVFVGPCIAKKEEALADGGVDQVLTFEELGAFLVAREIKVESLEEGTFDHPPAAPTARGFARSTGVGSAVAARCPVPVSVEIINGLDRKQLRRLKSLSCGSCTLLEIMACEGGCVAGPGVIAPARIAERKLSEYQQAAEPAEVTA